MLGNAGVTESNMMQYLGLIEQRTNELLQMYQQQQIEQPNAATNGQGQVGSQSRLGAISMHEFWWPLPSRLLRYWFDLLAVYF